MFKEEYPTWAQQLYDNTGCDTFMDVDYRVYFGSFGEKDTVETPREIDHFVNYLSSIVSWHHVDFFSCAPASSYIADCTFQRRQPEIAGLMAASQNTDLFMDRACTIPLNEQNLDAFDSAAGDMREDASGNSPHLYMQDGTSIPRWPPRWEGAGIRRETALLLDLDRYGPWHEGRLTPKSEQVPTVRLEGVELYRLAFSHHLGNASSSRVSPGPIRDFIEELNATVLRDLGIEGLIECAAFLAYNNFSHHTRANGAVPDPTLALMTGVAGASAFTTGRSPAEADHIRVYGLSAAAEGKYLTKKADAMGHKTIRDFTEKIQSAQARGNMAMRFEGTIAINVHKLRTAAEDLGEDQDSPLSGAWIYDNIIDPILGFWETDDNKVALRDIVQVFKPNVCGILCFYFGQC